MKEEKSDKRGPLLTLLVIFGVFSSIVGLYQTIFNFKSYNLIYKSFPSWYLAYLIVLFLVFLIAYYGLWKFKKWGVYLYFIFTFSGIFVNTFFVTSRFDTSSATIEGYLGIIVITALSIWVIYRKWHLFK